MTSTAAGPPISKKEVLAWIDDACDALRESAWAPALNASELGTFDLGAALQAPLLTALLGLFDTTCEPRAQRPLWKRVLVSSKDPSYSRWRFFILEQAARFLTERPGSTSVLFWPTQPTHPPVQVPVAKVLDEMGVTTRFITNRPTLFSHLRERGVRVVCAKYVWSSKIFGARAEASRKSQVLASDPDVQLPQLANYERTCLLSVLRGAIRSNLPRIHEALATTDAIARQMEPETLVVGNDVTPEGRIACLRAQRASIPTACLLHGTVTGWPIHGFHCADKVLVYGRNSERELVDFGTDPAKIVVSGAPVLDALPNQSGETNPVLQSRLGLATGKPWILLATSGPGSTVSLSHHQRTIENVMRASAVLPQYAFVAKLHRKDEVEHYHASARRVPQSRLRVVQNKAPGLPTDINSWLQGCPLVLTGASAVAVDAMMLGVPVITMDFLGELQEVDFIQAGATHHVESPEALNEAILSILENSPEAEAVKSRVDTYLKNTFCARDGDSSQRAANAIQALLRTAEVPHNSC